MHWDINVWAGLVAGVAAMVPGAVIYAPGVLGTRWMKEIGTTPEEIRKSGNPAKATSLMFVTSLINGLVASLLINSAGAKNVGDAVLISLILAWWWAAANLVIVLFEKGRSWAWFRITALSHVLTALVIGVVIGLFL